MSVHLEAFEQKINILNLVEKTSIGRIAKSLKKISNEKAISILDNLESKVLAKKFNCFNFKQVIRVINFLKNISREKAKVLLYHLDMETLKPQTDRATFIELRTALEKYISISSKRVGAISGAINKKKLKYNTNDLLKNIKIIDRELGDILDVLVTNKFVGKYNLKEIIDILHSSNGFGRSRKRKRKKN